MAKRRSFEEILKREFRWPRPGDDPFAVVASGDDHAIIEGHDFARFVLMIEGYKSAAETLVDSARQGRAQRDVLVYPIVFLYRHCLELQLKYIINNYGHHVGVEPVWNDHDLSNLWKKFLLVLEGFGTEDPDNADSIVGEIVAQFAKVDPRSFSYRYPRDTKGKPIPLGQNELDLESLKDVMEGAFGYFTGCEGYLDSLASAY